MFVASDFDYEFPKDLIAQHPNRDRDASRLLQYQGYSGHDAVGAASIVESLQVDAAIVDTRTEDWTEPPVQAK